MAEYSEKDRAIIVRIDGLSREQEHKLSDRIVEAKREIAPDARGTYVTGSQGQLPYQPIKRLEPDDDD